MTVKMQVKTEVEVIRNTYIKYDKYSDDIPGGIQECSGTAADLVGSDTNVKGIHLPIFDFDFPCRLVPSSTKGHFHLYVDKVMGWNTYISLMIAMRDAGLLDKGWVKKAVEDGRAYLRKEGVKK